MMFDVYDNSLYRRIDSVYQRVHLYLFFANFTLLDMKHNGLSRCVLSITKCTPYFHVQAYFMITDVNDSNSCRHVVRLAACSLFPSARQLDVNDSGSCRRADYFLVFVATQSFQFR